MKKERLTYCIFGVLILSVLCMSCGSDPADEVVPEPDRSVKKIETFGFEPAVNAGLSGKLEGVFLQDAKVIAITTPLWLDNLKALKPTFKAVGTVKVDGVEQISGVSVQDFSREVVYTVTAEDGSTRAYTILFRSPQTTGLPVLRIETQNRQAITSKEHYIDADILLYDPHDEKNNLQTTTEIRGRGNTTWGMPKKPYRLKFHKKTSLFGLAEEKSWVLLANYQDPTLIMNTVAFELGQRLGLPFTNHYHHVELYLNGTYQGSYMLTEQVQVKKSRVNVSETEGFLVEMDQYYDEDPKFRTNRLGLPIMIKSPDLGDHPGLDLSFVSAAIHALEAALFDEAFPANNYRELIDTEVMINYMLVNELMRNVEVKHPKSIYLYKDKGGKIGFGPPWDFDWAFGWEDNHYQYFQLSQAGTLLMRPGYSWDGWTGHQFFCRFFDDPAFRAEYKARWNAVYATQITPMATFIEAMGQKLEGSALQNGTVWGATDYQSQIDQMKRFWNERVKQLNTQINAF
ncbi:CotH kinase family protein [Parabacteroides sp. PF5-6]|uniref:CotH kinase family protein n=1 Tax=Parabacteroides sp. PF5-6 TaxID=1742403 RepID=UPI002404B654|nr:CotH kinase family protein [Parabacteroides sp. PF5-6]MDF9831268.1 spore coat protein CotH [Parabacteroides sp. PF5-6]